MFLNSVEKPVYPLNQFSCDSPSTVEKPIAPSIWNVFSRCLSAVDECAADLLKKIPLENPLGRKLRLLPVSIIAIPLMYAYSQNAISGFFALQSLALAVSLVYNRAANCCAKDIRQVIENSHREREKKEGVALILNASKWVDYNCAFGDDERHLMEVETLAKKFLIESKTVLTAQQLSETIEDVCNKSDKPVKLVIIRGHGALKEIQLSLFSSVKSGDNQLIEALKKTDVSAHIILKSCSTGKLRSEKGISFADQLSLNLPGRMVTGLSADAGSMLVSHNDYPQGMTVMSLQVAGWVTPLKQIFTHSFRVMENKRMVETLLPINAFNLDQMKRILEECQSATDLDAKYPTPSLINDYKCHFNFSFKDLCSTL